MDGIDVASMTPEQKEELLRALVTPEAKGPRVSAAIQERYDAFRAAQDAEKVARLEHERETSFRRVKQNDLEAVCPDWPTVFGRVDRVESQVDSLLEQSRRLHDTGSLRRPKRAGDPGQLAADKNKTGTHARVPARAK